MPKEKRRGGLTQKGSGVWIGRAAVRGYRVSFLDSVTLAGREEQVLLNPMLPGVQIEVPPAEIEQRLVVATFDDST